MLQEIFTRRNRKLFYPVFSPGGNATRNLNTAKESMEEDLNKNMPSREAEIFPFNSLVCGFSFYKIGEAKCVIFLWSTKR